jgi:nucleotide-binding universal stress UspA family protein
MAKRFLVPLDSSAEGEHVIPFIVDAARGAGATVRLVHVAPVPGNVVGTAGRTVAYADQEMSRLDTEHTEDLRRLEPHLGGIAVETVVRFGEPAEEILREADAFGADVIAVMTTCRSGVKRALLGSVAEQLLRKAAATVLLVRPADGPVPTTAGSP